MGAPVDTRDTRAGLAAFGSMTQPHKPIAADVDYADHTADIGDTAGAMWMQETIFGEALDTLRTTTDSKASNRDPSFNPYSYYSENKKRYDAEMPELDYFVRSGQLHGVRAPDEFEATVQSIQRELDRRDTINRGGYVGLGTGMLLSFADVTTAVPVLGLASKVGIAGKVAIGATNIGAQTTAQEAILHGGQYTRTFHESLMNIGISSALGGGLGAFHGAFTRGNAMHYANPKNPLLATTAIPTIQMESLGAAASTEKSIAYANQGLGLLDRAGRAMGMPAAVARSTDPRSAAIMENISSSGAVTKGHEAGRPEFANDAETIWDVDYQAKNLRTAEALNDIWTQVNYDMGGNLVRGREDLSNIPGVNRLVANNPVSRNDWDKHLVLALNDPVYKTGNAALDKGLGSAQGKVKTYFDHMFKRGVELGLFKPEQQLDNYFVQRWVSHKINDNPHAFEKMLLEKFVKTPDADWLKETHDLTKAEFDKLPDTVQGLSDKYKTADGAALEVPAGTKPPSGSVLVERAITKREVLKLWDEEIADDRVALLTKQVEVAEQAAKDADYAFRSAFREARKLDKTKTQAELMEVKAVVREQQAELEVMRSEKAQLEAEARALSEAATAARQKTLDRQLQHTDTPLPKPQLKSAAFRHGTQVFEGDSHADAMNKAIASGVSEADVEAAVEVGGAFGFTDTRGKFHDDQAAIQVAHEAGQMGESDLVLTSDSLKRFPPKTTLEDLEASLGITSPDDPVLTTQRAAREARSRAVSQELQRVDKRLRDAEQRFVKLQEAADSREYAASFARSERKRTAAFLKEAKAAKKAARTEKTKATRKLTSATKRVPVSEQAAEITRVLQNHGETPSGMLMFKPGSDEKVTASGRVKHRGIDLTPAELKEFIDAGYIDTNVSNILQAYTRDVGGRLAMLEKFGNVDLEAQVLEVQENYARLKAEAKGPKERDALKAQEKKDIETITVLRNRVLGIDGIPDNPEGVLMYANRVVRKVNFLRFMGGPLLSSVTDGATSALSNGGMGRTLSLFGRKVLKHAHGLKDAELRAVLVGSENSFALSRNAKNLGVDDLQWVRGVGSGMTRKVTSTVEGALNGLSEQMSLLNGMTWWNSRMRYISGQLQLANIVGDAQKLAKGGKLDAPRITEYARFGMSQDDLVEVAGMIQKHGEKNEGGLWDPNAQAWAGARGAALRRQMLVLLKRAAQEAVVAPTAMDIPPFMSRPAGRLLMQFQTFGFAATNKYIRNLRYKAVNGQAFDALMSVTWALALGATAYVLKEKVVKGNELTDKPGQWVYESVDRSGLVAFMSPLMNASFKLGAPALNSLGIDWFEQPSRYRQASWAATLLGPSVALGEDVAGSLTSLSQGDLDSATTKAARLVPFRNLFYIEAIWRRANGLEE